MKRYALRVVGTDTYITGGRTWNRTLGPWSKAHLWHRGGNAKGVLTSLRRQGWRDREGKWQNDFEVVEVVIPEPAVSTNE